MKDILKSKIMIGFIIFVLGFTYFEASLEQKKNDPKFTDRQVIQNENLNN